MRLTKLLPTMSDLYISPSMPVASTRDFARYRWRSLPEYLRTCLMRMAVRRTYQNENFDFGLSDEVKSLTDGIRWGSLFASRFDPPSPPGGPVSSTALLRSKSFLTKLNAPRTSYQMVYKAKPAKMTEIEENHVMPVISRKTSLLAKRQPINTHKGIPRTNQKYIQSTKTRSRRRKKSSRMTWCPPHASRTNRVPITNPSANDTVTWTRPRMIPMAFHATKLPLIDVSPLTILKSRTIFNNNWTATAKNIPSHNAQTNVYKIRNSCNPFDPVFTRFTMTFRSRVT
mmetsp:Transcript_31911/g.77552  ORF Transcript_31911/g.77552 Transcript_31911/m.77552 type:complete len:285 (-) Transcript_31911:945-1799(-)